MNRREFFKHSALAGVTVKTLTGTLQSQSMSSQLVRVGVIGSGARAQQLIESAMGLSGVEFVAVCDAYQGRAERARTRTGDRARIVKGYKDILAADDIDAVVIGTPDHWHKQMAIEAMKAGKDVYIEKPLTYTVDEGLEIIRAVNDTGRILQVGSQGMSSALQEMARQIVKEGRLGQITMIRASYNRNSAGGAWIYPIPPDASPETVDWQAFLGPAPDRPFDLERFFRWRCYWDYSGGIATDLFVHLLTTIHFVMDAVMPESAVAVGNLYRWTESRNVPDTLNGVLVYPEDFTVNISSTFNNQSSGGSGFEILGTEGSLIFRGRRLELRDEVIHDSHRWVVSSWPRELEEAYYSDPEVQAKEVPSHWDPEMERTSQVWNEEGPSDTQIHLSRFFESVRTRKQPIQDARFGHHAAAVAHMINRSVQEGSQKVEWDFEKDKMKPVASSK